MSTQVRFEFLRRQQTKPETKHTYLNVYFINWELPTQQVVMQPKINQTKTRLPFQLILFYSHQNIILFVKSFHSIGIVYHPHTKFITERTFIQSKSSYNTLGKPHCISLRIQRGMGN